MKKKIIRNDSKYYYWQLAHVFVLGIIVLVVTSPVWRILGFSFRVRRLFWILVLILFMIAFIFTILLSRKKRTIEITENYIKFPESKHFKYKFKKEEIEKIKAVIPHLWQIGRYLSGSGAGFKVVYQDGEKTKEVSQAVYADFNPEEIIQALKKFDYKVDEDPKNYFIKERT